MDAAAAHLLHHAAVFLCALVSESESNNRSRPTSVNDLRGGVFWLFLEQQLDVVELMPLPCAELRPPTAANKPAVGHRHELEMARVFHPPR